MSASFIGRRHAGAALLAWLPTAATAHPGHEATDFVAGFLHPFGGIDHLLVLLAVGWWSAATRARPVWAIPLAFAATMLGGALLGLGQAPLPFTEAAIVASLLLSGALLVTRTRASLTLALACLLPFAVVHGLAHGNVAAPNDAAPWLAGVMLATLALHLLGAGAGIATRDRLRWATPAAGALGLAAGVVLAFAFVAG